MVIVLISSRYKRILEWLKNEKYKDEYTIGVIKQNGPKVYLYIKTDQSYDDVIHIFNKHIKENKGESYVYAFYSIFNGLIDYNVYLSEATKMKMKYYKQEIKDITELEIENYLKTSNIS